MVELLLPKQITRVRFPSPAPANHYVSALYGIYIPNPRIESRRHSTDLLIPLPGLFVDRHSRYETARESKIVAQPLFHTPKAPIRVFWTDRSRKGRWISTHFVNQAGTQTPSGTVAPVPVTPGVFPCASQTAGVPSSPFSLLWRTVANVS